MSMMVTDDGISIYYKDWGTGKPVIFSHGWPFNADVWDNQLNFLAERGYRAIAYDRRGFGRSDKPWEGYNYDIFADDIKSLIDHLQLAEVTLVGCSMGGGDITRFIARHSDAKVRAMVLLSSIVPRLSKRDDCAGGVDAALFQAMKRGVRHNYAHFVAEYLSLMLGDLHAQAEREALKQQLFTFAMQASLRGALACIDVISRADFHAEIANIQLPTLIIHGERDNVVPMDTTGLVAVERFPNARLISYADANHSLFATHHARLNQDLFAFLEALSHH